jgi:hypothetical protein
MLKRHVRDSIGSTQIDHGACHGEYSCAGLSGELSFSCYWLLMHHLMIARRLDIPPSRAYEYI